MSSSEVDPRGADGALRRRVRLIVLLNAAEESGIAPIPILRLHMLAYLANVLAPVWDMPALDGKVLKRQGGPFYPSLQRDLDRLVGMGVARISNLTHLLDESNRWRLEGSYCLNHSFSERILQQIDTFADERQLARFIQELAFAVSTLSDIDFDNAMTEDATYSDPLVDVGNVVDFAEWQQKNFSANAAEVFEKYLPAGSRTTPGEKLHLYVRHLHSRIHGGR